jgi:acetoin utilization deacetylase AcuC-like enzyme
VIVSTHAGLLRAGAGTGVIDSRARIDRALTVLGSYEATYVHCQRQVELAVAAGAHDLAYLQSLQALAGESARLDPELVFDGALWQAALCACAAVVEQTRAARAGELRLCLSRPGSHHAGRDYALGGCVLNNIAVAAVDALTRGARAVAIIDFDAHHGNGTHDIFRANNRVLCVSLHQYPFFPGSGAADENDATNLNFPLAADSGDDCARQAYALALAAVRAFAPELVLFEAGVDAHWSDPTSDLGWEDGTFKALGEMSAYALTHLNAPAVFEFGGGYSEDSVSGGLAALLDGLGAARV